MSEREKPYFDCKKEQVRRNCEYATDFADDQVSLQDMHGKSKYHKHTATHSDPPTNQTQPYILPVPGTSATRPITPTPKLTCPTCHKTFANASNLIRHKRIHVGWSRACEICHQTFSRRDAIKRQMGRHIKIWFLRVGRVGRGVL